MGLIYAPFILLAIALTLLVVQKNNLLLVQPAAHTLQVNNDAGAFVAYRNAVWAYMDANKAFTGTIPVTSLSGQFSQAFLSGAGNYVTATGTAGRVITCYASVASGAVQPAVLAAGVDASIGTSNGAMWTSAAPGSTTVPTALNGSVPAGDIVSVIQIGS
jgi:hypothetical protein